MAKKAKGVGPNVAGKTALSKTKGVGRGITAAQKKASKGFGKKAAGNVRGVASKSRELSGIGEW